MERCLNQKVVLTKKVFELEVSMGGFKNRLHGAPLKRSPGEARKCLSLQTRVNEALLDRKGKETTKRGEEQAWCRIIKAITHPCLRSRVWLHKTDHASVAVDSAPHMEGGTAHLVGVASDYSLWGIIKKPTTNRDQATLKIVPQSQGMQGAEHTNSGLEGNKAILSEKKAQDEIRPEEFAEGDVKIANPSGEIVRGEAP